MHSRWYNKKSFHIQVQLQACIERGTCQALHGVVVGTSRVECRCQTSDQSNLATACDRAEEQIWVRYLLLNQSFASTRDAEQLFCLFALIQLDTFTLHTRQ